MSTSTHPHAAPRPAVEPPPGLPPAHEPPPAAEPRRPRRTRRLVVGALVALLAVGGGVAVQQVRSADAAAEQRRARTEFAQDVGEIRTILADPARAGENVAAALLRHELLLLAGEAPDATIGDRLVEQLREAADQLDEAAAFTLPDQPSILPATTVDPVVELLRDLDGQAVDVASTLRAAADDAETWLAAVGGLDQAAVTYAASTGELPDDDDPDVVADAWRTERERLAAYADAVERAGAHEASAPLADAHRRLVDGMRTLTDDALRRLESGDVDGYNALLADRLGGGDPFAFAATLEAARADVSEATIAGPLEDARARALGLLTQIEALRRATPAQLAELP